MEIKEILQFVKDDIIDIPSALDLLLVYIKDSDKNKGQTILKLVSDGNLKISSAENMINKLIEPTTGKVFFDGQDIAQMNSVALRRQIGYVV